MRSVLGPLLRGGGLRRGLVVVAATAVASGVLLCAVCIALIWTDDESGTFTSGGLNSIVDDPGTRPGVLFAAALLTLPPLLLLDQAVRVGSTTRARRDAALRIAGATRGDVRRVAALEVGVPSVVGAVLGVPVFLVLRRLLAPGGWLPADAAPHAWHVALVVLTVTTVGLAVGARSASTDPLSTARRVDGPTRLSWWGPVMLVVGAAIFAYDTRSYGSSSYEILVFVGIGLIALGTIASASWVAYAMARRAERRARTPARLLAARRVLAQPGAAGRAAAGIGAIGLTLGVTSAFSADILSMSSWEGDSYDDGALATVVAALVALAVVVGSIVVHATERLWESRRELAYLSATGTPQEVLDEALLREVQLVAVPLGTGAAVLGAVGYSLFGVPWGPYQLVALAGVVLTWLAVLLASWLAVVVVRPIARRAASPEHLRTE